MKNNEQLFIFTHDLYAANILKENGYTVISDIDNKFVFLNNSKLKFEKDEIEEYVLGKIAYSNIMYF